MGGAIADILVVPFFGQGHLNPSVELCKRLSTCSKSKVTLIIPSHLFSSIPSTLHENNPSVEVLQIDLSESAHGNSPNQEPGNRKMGQGIERFLTEKYRKDTGKTRPSCVVIDLMMSWCKEIFLRENIPIAFFFTCGAASTAMEHAAWKAQPQDMKPGETRVLTGLPDCVALKYSETKRRSQHGGPPPGKQEHGKQGPDFGLRDPGQKPRWLDDGDDAAALLLNTCQEMEGPFLDYISHQVNKPVFGVGPLLPDTYWNSIGKVVHDRDSRSNRKSNYTEDEISQWLDSKPSKSVIYIAFGSEVGPDLEEYEQLADALGDSKWSFIWVIQPGSGKPKHPPSREKQGSDDKNDGFYPEGLEEKVGKRGIIIRGWAPQLMILSHPSTGGFLSHLGWNSAVEAIGRGVPILAWPIRGDQYYNAKLVADYLKTGIMVTTGDNLTTMVKKSDIVQGIDSLMKDKEVLERAINIGNKFENGFPPSSVDSIKALIESVSNK